MISFKIQNQQLVVDEKTLIVPEFKAIWDKYTDKRSAQKMLTYVFGLADITTMNPFFDVPEHDLEKSLKKSIYKDEKHKFSKPEQKLIDDAVAIYKKLNEDSVFRTLRTINKKIDEINLYMERQRITSDNLNDQITLISKYDAILNSKAATEDMVAKQVEKQKAKGGFERSPLETGQIGYKPKK